MKDNKLSPVNFSRRMTAFFIDSFIICLTRSIAIQVLIMYWLQKYIIDFATGFKFAFSENFKTSNFELAHLRYFMQSKLFPRLLIACIFLILLSFVYNLIMLSSKWSATIGQKIVGIFAISKNETKMKWYQIILRSFLAPLPLNAVFIIAIYQLLGDTGYVKALDPQTFLLIVGLGLLSWYDLFFFTKDKVLAHDLLSGTKIVRKGEFSKGLFDKSLDLIDGLTASIEKVLTKIFRMFYKGKNNVANSNVKQKTKSKTKKKTKKK